MPSRPMQVACTPKCALVLARLDREKKAAKVSLEEGKAGSAPSTVRPRSGSRVAAITQKMHRQLSTLGCERDFDKPCVSCGNYHQGQWHAGHYLTVGARPELRFEP